MKNLFKKKENLESKTIKFFPTNYTFPQNVSYEDGV